MKQLNLFDQDNPCCGALLDRKAAQQRIDEMQRIIDACHQYINYGSCPLAEIKELKDKLQKYSSS